MILKRDMTQNVLVHRYINMFFYTCIILKYFLDKNTLCIMKNVFLTIKKVHISLSFTFLILP